MINIIQNRKYFFIFSGILVAASIGVLFFWGLNMGIDFTGGSLSEVSFTGERPGGQEVKNLLLGSELGLQEVKVQPSGDKEFLIRMRVLSEDEHQKMLEVVKEAYSERGVVENRFESIGPVIGAELKNKAWEAITIALIVIILYIAYTFRKVSKPVASWKYGVSAIVALAHDILIVTGIFAAMGIF